MNNRMEHFTFTGSDHLPASRNHKQPVNLLFLGAIAALSTFASVLHLSASTSPYAIHVPVQAEEILAQCATLKQPAGPPSDFHARPVSDRFVQGTKPTLVVNATIWTGARAGTEVVYGDLLFDDGLVKAIGYIPPSLIPRDVTVITANRAWVTPGIVDLHSHVGVMSAPMLAGGFSVSSRAGLALPWMRSIDGLNTHDEAYQLSIAGGVTSAQVLPGSSTAIGGQAFVIKLRKTPERTPSSMIVEPPYTLNGTRVDPTLPPRWRHLKQACGENLLRFGNRMDALWAFREAYDEARKVKQAQDDYCRKAEAGLWQQLQNRFPESLQWEMLVDVLRGRVKISNHCYEELDLDNIVRLSNEFQFHVASFHHASEAWLVPDVLKRMWGGPPAAAIFATNHRYKREAYRGSEFAPRILADNGIAVIMKSDHPVINSRYLLHEAQQAHYYGLPPHLALASITSTPAIAAGLDHRIGILQEGADADVVIWDSHPLALAAMPTQVFIDGIPQLENPTVVKKPVEFHRVPKVPDFDEEAKEAFEYEGLPPLEPKKKVQNAVFVNVKEVWTRDVTGKPRRTLFETDSSTDSQGVVVVEQGHIVCLDSGPTCLSYSAHQHDIVDLRGGSISPGLVSYGSALGLEEIASEPSTGDGQISNPFFAEVPSILGDAGAAIRAVDALQFGTRNALLAYRSGVTKAVTAHNAVPLLAGTRNSFAGLSVTFSTGSASALESGAIIKPLTALHVSVASTVPSLFVAGPGGWPSVSTQIMTLRRLLLGGESEDTETGLWFAKAAEGEIALVVEVSSADIMATLLQLKIEVEVKTGKKMRLSFSGAEEAHVLAKEIGAVGVGVILTSPRPFPWLWSERRYLPGPPLSQDSEITKLLNNNVTVGIGVREGWAARNARFDLAWAALEADGRISKAEALALASTNLENLLGIEIQPEMADLVAYSGGTVFDLSSKVVAIVSPTKENVEIL